MDTVTCNNCGARITEADILDTDTCPKCKRSGCLQDEQKSDITFRYGGEEVELSVPVARMVALALRVYYKGACEAPSFFCPLCPVVDCSREVAKEKLSRYS